MVSYEVVNNHGKPYVQVEIAGQNKTFSPEEISAMVLSKMKETAGDVWQLLLCAAQMLQAETGQPTTSSSGFMNQ